jgi:hypothetical protein
VPAAAPLAFGIDGFWSADVKPSGPVHAYVAFAIVEAVSASVPPAQTGPLLAAVGAGGVVFTVTPVLAAVEQPFTVAVTTYVPEAAAVTLARTGFWSAELKPFGPVQAYVAPATGAAVSASVPPAHRGLLLPATGTAGDALTTPEVLELEVWPLNVRVTVYVPVAAGVAVAITGFWRVDVKPFGPVQEKDAPEIEGVAKSDSGEPAHTEPPFDATTGGAATTNVVLVEVA